MRFLGLAFRPFAGQITCTHFHYHNKSEDCVLFLCVFLGVPPHEPQSYDLGRTESAIHVW